MVWHHIYDGMASDTFNVKVKWSSVTFNVENWWFITTDTIHQ